jgi:hypothetical protein
MIEQLRRLFTRQKPALPQAPSGETVLVNAYCTRLQIPQPTFAHVLHGRRDLSDAALLEHLNSFCGYVLDRGDGQMSRDKYHVILHLQRTQHHVSLSVGVTDVAALYAWAQEANAVLFTPDGHLLDPQGRILVNAITGKADEEASVPFPAQAWARKTATEALLAARGIEVSSMLPPVISEAELVLRDKEEIVGRARSLLLVALRAESVASGEPMSVDTLLAKMPLADDHLSPDEKAFLAKEAPSQQECAPLIARYESLYVLEWVLGLVDELPYPATHCDAATTVAKLIEMRDPSVRPAEEILDALDQTYRLHWHIRQMRLKKLGEAGGVDPDVVMERHHTLNWLVRYQYAGWDKVDTPT